MTAFVTCQPPYVTITDVKSNRSFEEVNESKQSKGDNTFYKQQN